MHSQSQSRGVRAFYNDSYEAYGANWTKDFLPEFKKKKKKRRGYNFESYKGCIDQTGIIIIGDSLAMIDYHETISDLLWIAFYETTNDFAHRYAKVFRK